MFSPSYVPSTSCLQSLQSHSRKHSYSLFGSMNLQLFSWVRFVISELWLWCVLTLDICLCCSAMKFFLECFYRLFSLMLDVYLRFMYGQRKQWEVGEILLTNVSPIWYHRLSQIHEICYLFLIWITNSNSMLYMVIFHSSAELLLYKAFGVRFPTAEDVASNVAPPSGHKLHLTSGTADMAMWSDRISHTVVAHDQSCVEVFGKPLISRCLCPPSSDGYLVEQES